MPLGLQGGGSLGGLEWVGVVVFGLLIGSFLNVVIYRLPKMMQRSWEFEAACIIAERDGKPLPDEPSDTFNIVTPRSRCRQCGHQLRWFENIPVFSWMGLRGKCSACGTAISVRYPLVELTVASWFAFCAWRFGLGLPMAAWCLFGALLLSAALIDLDTTYLPESLTFPLLWAALVASALRLPGVPMLSDAVWGAVFGYLALWSVYWGYKLITGKEGMGYGDFVLLSALCAWLGWQALLPIVLMSSLIGAVVGIGLKLSGKLGKDQPMPFGPFLAGAGFVVAVVGTPAAAQALDALLGRVGL